MSWIEFLIELDKKISLATGKINDELASEAETYRQRLQWVIENIKMNPTNWIVSDIKEENNEVARVEIKPLDVSHYIKHIFRHCDKTLMMSATILDKDAFCSSVGLAPEQVKFIRVGSDSFGSMLEKQRGRIPRSRFVSDILEKALRKQEKKK